LLSTVVLITGLHIADILTMPRPPETPDIRASKTLSYILRHGAEKEQLHIRSDGYLRLSDVVSCPLPYIPSLPPQLTTQLARPKMKEVDLATVLRLVEENAKQRFELAWGYDPSPPRPKKGKGQSKGSGKTKGQLLKEKEKAQAIGKLDTSTSSDATVRQEVDAAAVDDVQKELSTASIAAIPVSTELPLVIMPIPQSGAQSPDGGITGQGEWFIRATQGHSIQLESTAHLEPVANDEAGRARVGEIVHGTRWELWDVLSKWMGSPQCKRIRNLDR
jgi:2'-phosphotransferase